MSTSSAHGIDFHRQRKNLNWAELRAPAPLKEPVHVLLGDVRWLLTTNGLCLRTDDVNGGPIYYLHPPALGTRKPWLVKHRVRTRAQRAHTQTYLKQERDVIHILAEAHGAAADWLSHLGRIVHWTQPENVEGASDPKAFVIAQLRAFQFRGDRPAQPFAPSGNLMVEAAERLEIQVQMIQGNLLPAFAWYEEQKSKHSEVTDPLSILIAGVYGDVEAVCSGLESLSARYGSTQAFHHFAYLALKGAGQLEGAALHGSRAAELSSAMGAAGIYMDLARYQQRRNDKSGAWKSLVSGLEARPGTPWVNEFAASVFEWMGALDEAEKLYSRSVTLDGDRFGPGAALARLRTWRGVYDPVRGDVEALIAANPDEVILHRLLGIIHVCEGRLEEGQASLNRALEIDPRDPEALFWRADISLQQGRHADATKDIELASVKTSSPVDALLRILRDMELGKFSLASLHDAQASAEGPMKSFMRSRFGAFGGEEELEESYNPVKAFVHRYLPHLITEDEWMEFWEDEASAKRVLKRILWRFGGNRTDILTMREPASEPGKPDQLRWVTLPVGSREAAAEALKELRYEGPDAILARYEEVFKAFPKSPHPHCYCGELYVWLGRYEEALASFQSGKDLGPVRWGFVGKAAVLMLMGRKSEAMSEIERCGKIFEPLPGATTHVYLGELLRREGDIEGARRHLTEAIHVKPTRYAAAMNLALVELMAGDEDAAQNRYKALWEKVPGIFWTAGCQLEIPPEERCHPKHMASLIEESLRMMRGNRSSHLLTYFPDDGRMRIAPEPDEWEDIAWESLALREEMLLRD